MVFPLCNDKNCENPSRCQAKKNCNSNVNASNVQCLFYDCVLYNGYIITKDIVEESGIL